MEERIGTSITPLVVRTFIHLTANWRWRRWTWACR